MNSQDLDDPEGPWRDSDPESGLIARCWENWHVPVEDLSHEARATFLRQQIAHSISRPRA